MTVRCCNWSNISIQCLPTKLAQISLILDTVEIVLYEDVSRR